VITLRARASRRSIGTKQGLQRKQGATTLCPARYPAEGGVGLSSAATAPKGRGCSAIGASKGSLA
jgi:hypothetical protein